MTPRQLHELGVELCRVALGLRALMPRRGLPGAEYVLREAKTLEAGGMALLEAYPVPPDGWPAQ